MKTKQDLTIPVRAVAIVTMLFLSCYCPCYCSSAYSQESPATQEIAWKFKSGDNFGVSFDQESIVTSEFNLIERKIGSRVQLEMDWNVTAVSPTGVATIDQTITRIVMTIYVPQVGELQAGQEAQATEIVVDTDLSEAKGKVAKDMLKQIQPLIKANFTVDMQPDGTIDSVVASPATLDAIRSAPGSMKMRELLTPAGLKKLFGQAIVVLPKSEFAQGETWEANRDATSEIGTFNITDQFTFDGDSEFEGATLPTISVNSQSTLTTQPEDGTTEFSGAGGMGKLHFDAQNNYVVASEFRNEYTMSQPIRETVVNTNTISTVKMRIQKK